jgi:hypothetical protein
MENGKKNSDDIPHHNTATANKGNNNTVNGLVYKQHRLQSKAKQSSQPEQHKLQAYF